MSDSLPVVRVLVSKYPVLCQKSNCDNFDDAEEVIIRIIIIKKGLLPFLTNHRLQIIAEVATTTS